MGFTVYYQSTDPVTEETQMAIAKSLDKLCGGRTWLSCEPVGFFGGGSSEYLMGGSKPNFAPHPADTAKAHEEGLPDGTIEDVVEILCKLSADHSVDWQFAHDHDEGPIGFIRSGLADDHLKNEIAGIARMGDFASHAITRTPFSRHSKPEPVNDDNDGPTILKFGPVDE